MYVCMYVPIRRLHAHHAHACAQIDTVKIVNIDCVLTLNVTHQTTEACFKAQADLEEIETRKRSGRGSSTQE